MRYRSRSAGSNTTVLAAALLLVAFCILAVATAVLAGADRQCAAACACDAR